MFCVTVRKNDDDHTSLEIPRLAWFDGDRSRKISPLGGRVLKVVTQVERRKKVTMPKKAKPKHGGRRIGAGRKPDGGAAKVGLSLRVDPVVKQYLIASGNASRMVEDLVRFAMVNGVAK